MMAGKILGVGAVGLTQVEYGLPRPLSFRRRTHRHCGIDQGRPEREATHLFRRLFSCWATYLYSTALRRSGLHGQLSDAGSQQMQFLVMMPMILSVILS